LRTADTKTSGKCQCKEQFLIHISVQKEELLKIR